MITEPNLIPNVGFITAIICNIQTIIYPFGNNPERNMLEFDRQAIVLHIERYLKSEYFRSLKAAYESNGGSFVLVDFDARDLGPEEAKLAFVLQNNSPNTFYLTLFNSSDKPRPYLMVLNYESGMQSFSHEAIIKSENFYFLDLQQLECEATLIQQNYESFKAAQQDMIGLRNSLFFSENILKTIAKSDITDGRKQAANLNLEMLDQLVVLFNDQYGCFMPITVTLEYYDDNCLRLTCELYSYFEMNSDYTFFLRNKKLMTAYIRPEKAINPENFIAIHVKGEPPKPLQTAQPSTTGLFAPAPQITDTMQGVSNGYSR